MTGHEAGNEAKLGMVLRMALFSMEGRHTARLPSIAGAVMHLCVLRLNVGALGQELVDETELAESGRPMQSGLAILRWWRSDESAREGGRGVGRGGRAHVSEKWPRFACVDSGMGVGYRHCEAADWAAVRRAMRKGAKYSVLRRGALRGHERADARRERGVMLRRT